MREHTHSVVPGASRARRGLRAALIAVAGPSLAALAVASPAAAAASPPTITSAFTPTEIGVGDSTATALSFTIANPNASGTLSSVSLTDTLPAGLTVDNPNGENGTCGSAGVITAAPGSSTISLSGGSVKAGASCTFSVSVIASQTGTFTNSTGVVGSSAGNSASGSTQTLTVLPPPTLTVSGIKNNAKLAFGQIVKPTFTCAQPGDPNALADCSAGDDLGNVIASGQAIDTKDPGARELTVTATSSDGLSTTDTFDYTVLPDNRFTATAVQPRPHGGLRFALGLPGAGSVKVLEVAAKGVIAGRLTAKVTDKRTLHVYVTPTAAARKLLAGATAKPAVHKKATPAKLKVTLEITYTPTGGVAKTVTKRGIVLSTK